MREDKGIRCLNRAEEDQLPPNGLPGNEGPRPLRHVGPGAVAASRAAGAPRGGLPLELTSFVGREQELAEVELLLDTTRLLTISGPGGCGKTRLALSMAANVAPGFSGGVYFVGLASIADPALVPGAVARTLGVREAPNFSVLEALEKRLEVDETLLLMDNCEHLVEACAGLADALLRSCPYLKILTTSREILGVSGEVVWAAPPLSVLDDRDAPSPEALLRHDAARLFVERARSVFPAFALTEEDAPALARLCRRLDGMPLAIELAAARTRVLSVEQIAERLDDDFRLLAGGGRTAPPRQQTMRATIDWSHDLLSEKEKVLFRRLSVFAGGFSLEAAEEVCAGKGLERDEVMDLLTHLVDKSLALVVEQSGEARYRLLETVRQYGRENLEEAGEAYEVRRRQAAWSLALVERAEPHLKGRRQVEWLERLEREHDNLRAAIRWLLEEDQIETVARFSGALWFFWHVRGYQSEGDCYAREALEKGNVLPVGTRAKTVRARAVMSYGLVSPERTTRLFEESAALFRQAGDKSGLAQSLAGVGVGALMQGDMERSRALLEESLQLYRELGDKVGIGSVLAHLAMVFLRNGDCAQAARYFEEALSLSRETGHRHSGYLSLRNLALMTRGNHLRAAELYAEALGLAVELGDKADIAYCLEGLAGVATSRGDLERATSLFGASEALLETVGTPLYPHAQDRSSIERTLRVLRSRLGETAFAAAWEDGRLMAPEQAVAYALDKRSAVETQSAPELLRVFALGQTRVYRGEHDLASSDWIYAKTRELLFYLLSYPSRTKEQVGLALWPDASASQLRSGFHRTLHHLRRALGRPEWVCYEKGRYSFNRSLSYFFDVEAFESELAEARRHGVGAPERALRHLEAAVDLYKGDFLEELAVAEGDWTLLRQEELRREYLGALLTLGRLLFESARYPEAATAYRKAITHDELLEAAHRGLMRCYAALGERGQALRHYHTLLQLLRDELGSSPALETSELHRSLLRGEDV
jgi:predicted ATPase/two-component SAPR family response regulator